MAPVIACLKEAPWAEVRVLATAQHRQMLDQVLELFDIRPDDDLDVMQERQSLSSLTARLLEGIQGCIGEYGPDMVLAQGDTTTVFAASLAAFYNRIPFGHVEAGLRTGDKYYPFPEEINRVLVSRVADLHFAPTASARDNLLAESVTPSSIFVTGNTVIDALLETSKKNLPIGGASIDPNRRLVLVTAHRRENFGTGMERVCESVRRLIERNPDIEIAFPVHRNPNVRETVYGILDGVDRVHLLEPLEYGAFVSAMNRAYVILTDSGGVQEEAPALGKPVLVLRNETERPEAVAEGVVKLVGTDTEVIVRETQALLDDPDAYGQMARGISPYGDGYSATRIVDVIGNYLEGG